MIPTLDFPKWAARRVALDELRKRLNARAGLLPFTTLFKPDYAAGWVHQEVAALLDAFIEAVERRMSPRLMIFLPPRTGKSELVSRKFPPYVLGKHPEWEVVAATYGQDLANMFGRQVRNLCNDPLYLDLFPSMQIAKDSNAVDLMGTAAGGGYRAVGVGGALTGAGATILLVDDPVKDREAAESETQRAATWDWYSSVARTRLAPGGGIIVLQTRWHEEDLAGKLLAHAKENPDADQWHVYSYPMLATEDEKHRRAGEPLHPERYSLKEVLKIKATLQPRDWHSLYQQNPTPPDGILFKRDWIKYYQKLPDSVYYYIATDFAIGEKDTNDYTVILPFAVDADDNIYICEPTRARMDALAIVDEIVRLCALYKPMRLALETGHISKTIGPILRKRMQEKKIYTAIFDATPTKDKVARSRSFQGRMQQGKVLFLKSAEDIIIPELLAFPAGKHDDCFPADTPVLTERGWMSIQHVTTRDRVWTRGGWRKVLKAWSKGFKRVITRFGITATPEHRIYTTNRGWVCLDALSWDDTVLVCNAKPSSSREPNTTVTRRRRALTYEITSGVTILGRVRRERCTAINGRIGTVPSHPDTISTTATAITSTTGLPTWNAAPRASTVSNTQTINAPPANSPTWLASDPAQPHGIVPLKADAGTANTTTWLASVLRFEPVTAKQHAASVGRRSRSAAHAHAYVHNCVGVDGPRHTEPTVEVFDLMVEHDHEFVADGVLVHNCVDVLAWSALMLDTIVAPTPPPGLPTTNPEDIPGTYEWIQKRSAAPKTHTRGPQSLFAHLPKKAKGMFDV